MELIDKLVIGCLTKEQIQFNTIEKKDGLWVGTFQVETKFTKLYIEVKDEFPTSEEAEGNLDKLYKECVKYVNDNEVHG